ncbi:MAG: MFS transporter [Candidatus Levybacteria bacterium]|nr:MFS transporter [Candidatus Levybacteria bacterium]
MQTNITIAYFLVFFRHAYLWVGIWVFYYLRFTNYAGIGLLESALIITLTLAEIPTGAIADMFGKKKTLIVAFLLQAVGIYFLAYAGGFSGLLLGIIISCVGGAFYSGTIEALVYDSLKQMGRESLYDKAVANMTSISMIAPAVASVIGGFLYLTQPNLPFIIHANLYLLGFLFCLFLIEPKIDTQKFSLQNFFSQTKYGLKHLFTNTDLKRQTMLLLVIGGFSVMAAESVNDFLGVEFGFRPEELGILWAVILLIGGLVSQAAPHFKKYTQELTAVFFIGVAIALTFLISPVVGLWIGGLSLLIRVCFQGLFRSLSMVLINEKTPSQYRATTISSFNLLQNIPYVATAFYIGSLSDLYTAKIVSGWMGAALLLLLGVLLLERFRYGFSKS